MTDGFWWQLLLAFGYGVIGSVVPVVNGEALIIAALATNLIGPVAVGLGLGAGQGVGKAILFQAVRQGRRLPIIRRRNPPTNPPAPGRLRRIWSQLVAWGTRLVEHPRWGPLGLFLSGSLSLPPNYPTTILAATTRLNYAVFSIFMTLGFVARYVGLALLLAGVFDRLIS